MLQHVLSSIYCVFMLSIVSFFMGFCVGSSDDKVRSDKINRPNHVRQYVTDLKS